MPLEPIIIIIAIIIILMHVLNVFFTANITSQLNSQSLRPELKIKTIFKRMGGFCASSQNQLQYNFDEFRLLLRESAFDTQTKYRFCFVNIFFQIYLKIVQWFLRLQLWTNNFKKGQLKSTNNYTNLNWNIGFQINFQFSSVYLFSFKIKLNHLFGLYLLFIQLLINIKLKSLDQNKKGSFEGKPNIGWHLLHLFKQNYFSFICFSLSDEFNGFKSSKMNEIFGSL